MSGYIGKIGERMELILRCTGEGAGAPYYNDKGKPLPPKDYFWFEDEEKRSCIWYTDTIRLKKSFFPARGRTYKLKATIKKQYDDGAGLGYSKPVTVLERVSIVEEIREGE